MEVSSKYNEQTQDEKNEFEGRVDKRCDSIVTLRGGEVGNAERAKIARSMIKPEYLPPEYQDR